MPSSSTLTLSHKAEVWGQAPHGENTPSSRRRTWSPKLEQPGEERELDFGPQTNRRDRVTHHHKVSQEMNSWQLTCNTNVFVPQHFSVSIWGGSSPRWEGAPTPTFSNDRAGRSLQSGMNSSRCLPNHQLLTCDPRNYCINQKYCC